MADVKGDNYDLVDLLLEHSKKIDKRSISNVLFYFLKIGPSDTFKVKSIYEIVKNVDKLDLSYTAEGLNNVLHHIATGVKEIDQSWRNIIEIILKGHSNLMDEENLSGETPRTIDCEKSLGIQRIEQDIFNAKSEPPTKQTDSGNKPKNESKKLKKKKSSGSGNKNKQNKDQNQNQSKELKETGSGNLVEPQTLQDNETKNVVKSKQASPKAQDTAKESIKKDSSQKVHKKSKDTESSNSNAAKTGNRKQDNVPVVHPQRNDGRKSPESQHTVNNAGYKEKLRKLTEDVGGKKTKQKQTDQSEPSVNKTNKRASPNQIERPEGGQTGQDYKRQLLKVLSKSHKSTDPSVNKQELINQPTMQYQQMIPNAQGVNPGYTNVVNLMNPPTVGNMNVPPETQQPIIAQQPMVIDPNQMKGNEFVQGQINGQPVIYAFPGVYNQQMMNPQMINQNMLQIPGQVPYGANMFPNMPQNMGVQQNLPQNAQNTPNTTVRNLV